MAKTANEEVLDATVRHQIKLLRFSNGEAQVAADLLAQSDAELVKMLQSGLTETSEARLRSLLADVRRLRLEVAKKINDELQADMAGLASTEADWEVAMLTGATPVAVAFNSVPPNVLKAVASSPINGIPLEGWLGKMAANDVSRVEQQLRLGILQGETIDQMVRRIRGTKAAGYADGVLATTRREAEMIARTATNHVSTAARQATWDANADVISGVRWVATLDGRTSPVCQSRDGEVYPIDKGPRPPAHPNCRSTVAPVLHGEEIVGDRPTVTDTRTRGQREVDFRADAKAKAGDKWGSMTAAERNAAVKARRDQWTADNIGSAPTTTNYQKWLKGQSKAFQDDVLGPGKAELFRKGVPLDKFVDAQGKPYSLKQLQAELAGDKLNVIQPGVGLKAKSLLQQGIPDQQVLSLMKAEFPDASTSLASIASYKSELKKAGLLDTSSSLVSSGSSSLANGVAKAEAVVGALEANLPAGLKHSLGSQWVTLADELQGSPGVYAFYQAGKGVVASLKKLAGIGVSQAQQVLAHELGHLLHKQHQVLLPDDVIAAMKAAAKSLDPDAKKLYSYYLTHLDELTAEVYAQALSPSPLTSQGLLAGKFNQFFGPAIDAAKLQIAKKFPAPPPSVAPLQAGAPVAPFEVAGKHTSIGSLAKALLQQGMPDTQVLAAIKAEFPGAKTGLASIASYKSELNKLKKIGGKSGPTVAAVNHVPSKLSPTPPVPAVAAAAEVDPLAKLMSQAPAASGVGSTTVKNMGIKLMEAGLLKNDELAAALAKLYPQNKVSLASISTWKSVWKKANPAAYAKAASKGAKLGKLADAAGPTKLPFLHGKALGAKSTSVLNQAKAQLAAGAPTQTVQKFIEDSFGGAAAANAQGVSNLLELAVYQVDTAKALGKPYLNAAAGYKPPPAPALPVNVADGKVLPAGMKVATDSELDEIITEALDGDDPNALDVIAMAKEQGLVVKPSALKQWLKDAEVEGTGLDDDLMKIANAEWNALPNATAAATSAAKTAAKKAGPVDMTPSRLAATPYEGMPPPPRFTAKQRAAALKSLSGESSSADWAQKVNARYGLTGDAAVTPEEMGIIRSYTGNKTYRHVNEVLRNGGYASNPAIQAYVDAAQHGMRKMPAYVGPVTRGVRSLPPGWTMEKFLSRYQVGNVVEEHQFLSTARGTSAVYHGPVYFRINSLTGRDVDWVSKFSGNEREVLMMPGTRIKITKVEKDASGKWIIWADEVI
jgi:SPP1 gp7 family putative phage head morphogenesis protein